MKLFYNSQKIPVYFNSCVCDLKYINPTWSMSRNLFNIETLETGAYTAPISCISGQTYRIYRIPSGVYNTQYRTLDSGKNILGTVTASADGYVIPTEASYVQVHILGGTSAYSDTVVIEGTHCYDWYESYGEMHNYTK